MRKFLALAAIISLFFASCETPLDDSGTTDKTPTLPSLTIKNESSYILTDVKFSGISFAAQSSGELPPTSQSLRQLTANDVNKAGYITFIRKDIGIACRTEAISISDQNYTFTFIDSIVVEELANSGNKKPLSQITFVSRLVIERGGLNVARNDTVNLGEMTINAASPAQTEFVLKNTGVGKLLLNGNEPVKVTGAIDAFSVVQPNASEIAPNASLVFKINFSPQEAQSYGATVSVSANDPSGDFSFTVSATGVAPKPVVGIYYGATEIAQNGTINAGDLVITQSKNIDVIIKNTGSAVLTLDTENITITGANAGAFTKLGSPGANISPGSQSQFSLQYTPSSEGENNATLNIPTNDSARNPVVVYLRAGAVRGAAVLELSQDATPIQNNSLNPFEFGQIEIGTNKTLTFTIKNTGNVPLQLTGSPAIESSNTVFTIPSQPANTTIAPNATVSFLVRYTPAMERNDNGAITIMNNSDSLIFNFPVKGSGYEKKAQIGVKQGAAAVAAHGAYDFGTIAAGKTKDVIFTVTNSGDANLIFTNVNNNRINMEDNDAGLFSVTNQPTASAAITPGSSATFTLRFSPQAIGSNFSATVKIITNSRDNDEFIFTIKGNARAPYTEARLNGMQFSHGKLDQQFNANIPSYTLKIDAGLTLVRVTPIAMNSSIAGIKVNNVSQNSGVPSQDIILASTGTVSIVVTAEDETTTETYTVTINRIVNYSSAALSSLYVSNMDGTDEEDTLEYFDQYGDLLWWALPDETQLKFKVTPLNTNATVKINNVTIINGAYTSGYTLNPGEDETDFTITVISEDGENQRIFYLPSYYRGSQWEYVDEMPESAYESFNHTVIVHNNQFIVTVRDEVFASPIENTWWNKTHAFNNITYEGGSTVLFNNTIYNIGGYKNIGGGVWEIAPNISYSTNGTIWNTASSVSGLSNGITNHTSLVFAGALWTLGGTTKTAQQTNAIWKSSNGTAWTQQSAPAWGARAGHAAVVFNNKMFVLGGWYNDGNSEYRDVWSSANGTAWTQETSSPAWSGRNDHTVNVNSKGMWLVGGNDGYYRNDVWFSRNGKDWVKVLENAPFDTRAYHASVVQDGYLYIFGGYSEGWDNEEYALTDIWRTYIGE
jgi:hypothetical protein